MSQLLVCSQPGRANREPGADPGASQKSARPVGTVSLITPEPPGTGARGDAPEDDLLVARARRGERDALDALLRQQYDRVHAVCRRMTGNEADAADAAQEALIAVVRGLPRFDSRSRFSTWVYRIAVNAAIDETRRRRRRPVASLDEARLGSWVAGGSVGAGDGASNRPIDPQPDAAAQRLDVEAALMRLPVEFRGPVVLRDLCGLDYAEIAEALDLPGGTVRSRIARGRAALAAMLEPVWSDP
ncbi:MAG: RNA polymerase sigma factor [Acidimicrobiales bacterium]